MEMQLPFAVCMLKIGQNRIFQKLKFNKFESFARSARTPDYCGGPQKTDNVLSSESIPKERN